MNTTAFYIIETSKGDYEGKDGANLDSVIEDMAKHYHSIEADAPTIKTVILNDKTAVREETVLSYFANGYVEGRIENLMEEMAREAKWNADHIRQESRSDLFV